ncbi:hypothetical protein GCM10023147_40890 [Tsukamurella soli]|uniref:Uncharacterized protein n=1 Tax=Tsukamurella soli TaxID=644556 RepID=A0ABP8K722_9ACTN
MTVAVPVTKSTDADTDGSTLRNARSTRFEHATHVIPDTRRRTRRAASPRSAAVRAAVTRPV